MTSQKTAAKETNYFGVRVKRLTEAAPKNDVYLGCTDTFVPFFS